MMARPPFRARLEKVQDLLSCIRIVLLHVSVSLALPADPYQATASLETVDSASHSIHPACATNRGRELLA
jgi:hypothetical protein